MKSVTFDALTEFKEFLKIYTDFLSGNYCSENCGTLSEQWDLYVRNGGCPLEGLELIVRSSIKGYLCALCDDGEEYEGIVKNMDVGSEYAQKQINWLLDIPTPDEYYGEREDIDVDTYIENHPVRAFWIHLFSGYCSVELDTTGAKSWEEAEAIVVYEKMCVSNLRFEIKKYIVIK